MPFFCYAVLAMVRNDLDSLPLEVRGALNNVVLDAYADDSPDNWKPFGDNVPICKLVERVGTLKGVHFESLSLQLTGDPGPEALFRVFVMTNVYIIDCLSLENPRIAALASKIELAAHRSAAFFVPFDFGDKLKPNMHKAWRQKLPLLEFARAPSEDLLQWRNRYIYHEVPSKASLEQNLLTVLEDIERARQAGWPGAGQPTPRARQLMGQYLDQLGIPQGPKNVPKLRGS